MVVDVQRVKPKELRLDCIPAVTRKAFLECIKFSWLQRQWYLAGGTALALQVGHRSSVDLDFFVAKANFKELAVERQLLETKKWTTSFRQAGTIYGTFNKARMSFIAYPFFIPSNKQLRCGTVRILLPEDIAAMKIVAISQRGRKRDFVDLYWYCLNLEPLVTVVRRAIKQYPGQEQNLNHILRSLTYFEDADSEPMPKIYFKANWRTIKKFFRREVTKVARKFLELE